MDAPVMIDQIQEMLIKRRLARRLRSRDLEFLTKRLIAHLFPEKRNAASDLEETHDHVVHSENGLGLDKVGDVAIVVDTPGPESSSSAFPAESAYQGETRLWLLLSAR